MANKKNKQKSNANKLQSCTNSSKKSNKTNADKSKSTQKQNSQNAENQKLQTIRNGETIVKEKNIQTTNKTKKTLLKNLTIPSTPPEQEFVSSSNANSISYAQTVGYDHCVNNVKYIFDKVETTRQVEATDDIPNQRKKKFDTSNSSCCCIEGQCNYSSFFCSQCFTSSLPNAHDFIGPVVYYKKPSNKINQRYNNNSSSSSSSSINSSNTNTNQIRYHRRMTNNGRSDKNHIARHSGFAPIIPPIKPILSSSNIAAVIANIDKIIIMEKLGKGRHSYPTMQCGTLEAPDSTYHIQRFNRMDVFQIDDGFHSDGGTETPPPSPSSASSIASTSDHGSLESVDTGGAQRLAVLSFEQVRKLHDVMDETVAIHGRGNFPTLEVKLKDLVNLVRRKLEADVVSGGAGVIVKDIRLNGGAASHVLASEDQPYNDLDLIYAIEFSSSRHFDRVKSAVLNTLLDLLPEGVSKRRIMPCALKEAYVGKMVKVNNNNDGDRWSLISLGNSPGHKNVELKFVDTMRRQFEFSVDSFQIVLDSLLLFYDCAALPISENFYPTVVGESVYGDFQEALYHLQKKLISTRQPEEIRGGGLLKYCNLLVRNYKPVEAQRIKTLERYMCSRFFIDFPDINTQTVKLEAYLRNHFWGIDEEPLQYQYLMHLREVVETSTVCLMGHERRQTLLLIQSLAMQVLCREQQKQQHQAHQTQQEQYHHLQQQQQQQHIDMQVQQQQQQQMLVQQHQQNQTSVTTASAAAAAAGTTTTICCQMSSSGSQQDAQQQQTSSTSVATGAQQQQQQQQLPQTIQIQAGPPGLIYANGVYYAPVIPATICTCNSTWLST